ncbi:MAG: hypothetical protein M3R17_12130 [Bacteroidota bacterium]|nr:hypothetical protein [Bacteroidota bacterium]
MKVPINQPVTIDQVRASVVQEFPQYTISMRTPALMVVKKSGTAAALVMVRKNKIIVNEGFATMGGQMVFTLTMILFGILIPLIIYFTSFYPKQKAVVREVAGHLTTQFG